MNIGKALIMTTFFISAGIGGALAAIEPDYNADQSLGATPFYATVTTDSKKADMDFITGMRPHHAGALTMSQEYLDNPEANNQSFRRFAKGIIRNQTFEIAVFDAMEANLKNVTPQVDKPAYGLIATQGVAQRNKFLRSPLPVLSGEVGAEEVRFSKAMIIHHQGAVDMCKAYNRDPLVNNGYLKSLCFDIIKDQNNDIDFMNHVIAQYKGNPDDIKIDPSMIHGMDGMMGHGNGHHKTSPTSHKPAKMDHSKHH